MGPVVIMLKDALSMVILILEIMIVKREVITLIMGMMMQLMVMIGL